jgi:hypothetical protein
VEFNGKSGSRHEQLFSRISINKVTRWKKKKVLIKMNVDPQLLKEESKGPTMSHSTGGRPRMESEGRYNSLRPFKCGLNSWATRKS